MNEDWLRKPVDTGRAVITPRLKAMPVGWNGVVEAIDLGPLDSVRSTISRQNKIAQKLGRGNTFAVPLEVIDNGVRYRIVKLHEWCEEPSSDVEG